MRRFEGEQQFVGQTFVAVARTGWIPANCDQRSGDTAVRDLVAAASAVRVRHPRPAPRLRTGHHRGTGRGAAPDGAAGCPDQGPLAAGRVCPAAGRLGGLGGRGDSRASGCGRPPGCLSSGPERWAATAPPSRTARATARAPAGRTAGPPGAGRPRLRCSGGAEGGAAGPGGGGPAYDELPMESFTTSLRHGAPGDTGCRWLGGRPGGPEWLEAVTAQCPSTLRTLITELAVEPLRMAQADGALVRGQRAGRPAGAMVERQVAELSRGCSGPLGHRGGRVPRALR